MIPEKHQKEWNIWTTRGFDARYGRKISPLEVVAYPKSYGFLRPDNLPYRNNHAFISVELLPELQKFMPVKLPIHEGLPLPDHPVIQVWCEPPPPETELLGISTIDPYPGLAFIPLRSANGGAEW
jgi:hypothetical protein